MTVTSINWACKWPILIVHCMASLCDNDLVKHNAVFSPLLPGSGVIMDFGNTRRRHESFAREFMESPGNSGAAALLVGSLLLVVVIACSDTRVPSTPIPPATPLPAPTAPPAPTPTDEQRRIQTPMNFGTNTRVVDGDIHVWHIPTCPPVPPATWVAPVILTDLRSGSNLHLNRDGSVRDSPAPDYRSDEGRDRLAEVLEDSSLMELILAPMECP